MFICVEHMGHRSAKLVTLRIVSADSFVDHSATVSAGTFSILATGVSTDSFVNFSTNVSGTVSTPATGVSADQFVDLPSTLSFAALCADS